MGQISTGAPMPVPDSDFGLDGSVYVEISSDLLPPGVDLRVLFALEVIGSGMIDAGLAECDIVVLEPVQEWTDGDIVAVWLPESGETMLARLYRHGQGYRLESANPTVRPVLLSPRTRLEVKGKVVAMVRTIRD
jgi:SOS-response transcriptional repressor LexA